MILTTLYRRTTQGTVAFWRVTVSEDTVTREWGIENGKTQRTTHRFRPIQNRSASEVAWSRTTKLIEDRKKKGFTTSVKGIRLSTPLLQPTEMRFHSLSTSFAPQKPIQEAPEDVKDGDYIIQRKRDGQRHFVLITNSCKVRIYTRTGQERTDHMPALGNSIRRLKLPPRSVLDGELVCDRDGRDDFRATQSICRADVEKAIQAERNLPIQFMVFDYLFRDGEPIYLQPYKARWSWLVAEIPSGDGRVSRPSAWSQFEIAQALVRKHRWEGLVLWEKSKPCILRMDGKPSRNGCYKWKPIRTGDFIAMGWENGTGRYASLVGRLRIGEFQNGVLVEIGRVGTGLSDAQRREALRWIYPCVVELEYVLQQEDTRALREPVFLRVHPDKTVKEMR